MKEFQMLPLSQKLLLLILYALIILMVVFSIGAMKNKGENGFDRCIQQKCESRGQEYCTKPREVLNCCKGAGGELTSKNGRPSCAFP